MENLGKLLENLEENYKNMDDSKFPLDVEDLMQKLEDGIYTDEELLIVAAHIGMQLYGGRAMVANALLEKIGIERCAELESKVMDYKDFNVDNLSAPYERLLENAGKLVDTLDNTFEKFLVIRVALGFKDSTFVYSYKEPTADEIKSQLSQPYKTAKIQGNTKVSGLWGMLQFGTTTKPLHYATPPKTIDDPIVALWSGVDAGTHFDEDDVQQYLTESVLATGSMLIMQALASGAECFGELITRAWETTKEHTDFEDENDYLSTAFKIGVLLGVLTSIEYKGDE